MVNNCQLLWRVFVFVYKKTNLLQSLTQQTTTALHRNTSMYIICIFSMLHNKQDKTTTNSGILCSLNSQIVLFYCPHIYTHTQIFA